MAFTVGRSNTILYCQLWADTVDFYRRVLGLAVSFENDWFVELVLGGDSFVSVADAARATIPSSGGAGITLSWQVADVAASRLALAERGVAVGEIISRWGAATLFVTDPEGNRIELWSPAAEV
jgi:catechol 2,3-dioxygenase-like lactoylglutathione lyase family enzyme